MVDYMISIEAGNGETEEILAELTDAQKKVYKGYNRLQIFLSYVQKPQIVMK